MKISFNLATVTGAQFAGVLALMASAAPDVLTSALELTQGDGGHPLDALDASKVFATAPMPALAPDAGDDEAAAPAPAPAPTAPAVVGGVQLDANGLPWDERIHATVAAGGGSLTDKGVWRNKRSVPPTVKTKVEAELRAALASPGGAPAPAVPPPPPPAAPAAAPPPPSAPVSPAPPAAPPPLAAPTPAAPAAAAGSGVAAFGPLMVKVTAAQTAGSLTAQTVTETLAAFGLTQLRDLLANPDLIPAFEATIDASIPAA